MGDYLNTYRWRRILFLPFLAFVAAILSGIAATGALHSGLPATVADSTSADSAIVRFLKEDWGVKFTSNNSVVIFKNGKEKFDDLFGAIRAARSSIHLEYFNFRNDSISECLFRLLAEQARKGVKVRILFDGFGNSSNNRPLKKKHIKSIREQGIEIYEFDPLRFPWINHAFHRDHRKIVVIDGQVAYTGGMNVADYYIKGKPEFGDWRDIHARIEGDAVGQLQAVFIGFWNKVTQQTVQGPEYYPGEKDAGKLFPDLPPDTDSTARRKMVGVVNRDPVASPRIIHDTFIAAINGANKQIQIINPYLTLCSHVKRALRKAIRRGVDVQIMVSAKSDIPVTPRIVEYNVGRLMKQGAKVYFYVGGFHHSKIMMVDSLYAFIGSANLNSRSLSFDYECNLLIADVPTTRRLQNIFENDKQTRCFLFTPERQKALGGWKRFKGWMLHWLSPLVREERQQTGPTAAYPLSPQTART